jgi:DNA-binding response OmpR family regulator
MIYYMYPSNAYAPQLNSNKISILVCEGEELLRKLMIRYIETATDWEVHGVGDGHLAEQFLGIRHYDIVVCAHFLDFKNGLDVLAHIRQQVKSDIPVIVLTSDPHEHTALLAFGLGANDVIETPIGLRELTLRLQIHLRKYQEVQQAKQLSA